MPGKVLRAATRQTLCDAHCVLIPLLEPWPCHPHLRCLPHSAHPYSQPVALQHVSCTCRPCHPQALERIDEIRTKRQERFHELRMARAKAQQSKADRVQLEKEIHLVKAPDSLRAEKQKLKVAAEAVAQREGQEEMQE